MDSKFWQHKRVAVLGGAALIGSHLVEELLKLNPKDLWVVDDLSSGKRENVPSQVSITTDDLREYESAALGVSKADVVFHLACAHGGRGFVNTHRLECIDNLSLDSTVFRACANEHVGKVIFASSACAYPIDLQQDQTQRFWLQESHIDYDNIRQPDGAYGFGKLAGELALDAYIEAGKFEGVSCRFFTVMGRRMKENHAVLALIAKAFLRLDPFPVWGAPDVVRNWTWVSDTVSGLILSAEQQTRGAVNIGSEERITVGEAVRIVLKVMDFEPQEIQYDADAPVGVRNRVSNSFKARLMGWRPQVSFENGVREIAEWYKSTHTVEAVRASLSKSLTGR